MKKNQKGFSAVEAVLILVIVGLIGFVGWYVWHSKNNIDNSYKKTSELNSSVSTAQSSKGIR
jgi:predicted negative regulator of RcsB-dependent stress response